MSTKHFGAASAADLLKSIGTMPAPGIGTAFSFERAAGHAIEQVRNACKGVTLPTPAETCVTYVFCDDLETAAAQGDFESVNRVWTADTSVTLDRIENRIVLISRNGRAGCCSAKSYQTLAHHADALAMLGLEHSATMLFQLHSAKVTLLPQGINGDEEDVRPFGTISHLLVGNMLQNVLDDFDNKWLNAQAGHAMVWEKVPKYTHVPVANTEKVIQAQVQLALIMADAHTLTADEIPNPDGRADLLLVSKLPGGEHRVVLELKVLRSYSFPAKRKDGKVSAVAPAANEENAQEVVKQAHRYRKHFGAQRACARVYDMRKPPAENSLRKTSGDLAAKLKVDLWFSDVHFNLKAKRNAAIDAELKALAESAAEAEEP